MRQGITRTHTEPLTLDIIKQRIRLGQPPSRVERKWLVEQLEDARNAVPRLESEEFVQHRDVEDVE